MKQNKTIVIGLDGATWDNLLPWIEEGELPFFKKLLNSGVHGKNMTTIPSLTCPAIPSFYTGKSPIKTRTFGFRKRDGGIISANDIRGRRVWDILGENNIKCFIYGLRTTYPPKIKNGVLMSSFLVPDEESDFICPRSEKEHFKGYLVKDLPKNEIINLQKNDRKKLFRYWMDREIYGIKLVEKYLKNKKFGFYLIYFSVTDALQHYLWENQELILETYKELERILEKLFENFKDHNILFFSDHGFGSSPIKNFYIEKWLSEIGMLKFKSGAYQKISELYKKMYYSVGWFLEKHLTKKRFDKIYHIIKKSDRNCLLFNIDPCESDLKFLNMNETKAILDQKWGIKIIKKNMEDSTKEKLIEEMKRLKNADGDLVFNEVYKKEEFYPDSKEYDEIPDIIFTVDQKYEVRAGYSNSLFSDIKMKRLVEGSHEYKRNGIFIALGPDIKKNKEIQEIKIYDFTPTILHMYGIPIPKDMDGRVLTEIFKEDSEISKRKIEYANPPDLDILNKCTKEIKI